MMEVISTRRYEARPPASAHPGIVYDPENSIATVKEEEWETRKKKEITTTRQIETRVKRQVVLEDGEIVVDSGPLVTTNTTEDVEQQEHTTQERRTTGDEPQEVEWPVGGKGSGGIVQKELNETVVRSREEIKERLETEDRQQLGDISDEAYQKAIRTNRGDLRIALAESAKQLALQSGPRILQHTTKSNKVVDTENKLERSELKADGLIITETKKTVEHEEIKDDEVPDDGTGDRNEDAPSETRKESSQRFLKTRDEDVVDYVSGGEKIAREMRYVSETTEGERIGDWPPPPTTMRTTRLHKHSGFPGDAPPASRKDAVTKKPLDLEEEDEARKFETSKWLESHFGSESRSSHGSIEADDPPVQTGTNTSFINVTMKSCTPARDREYTSVNSNRYQQRRTSGRDSSSPSGYFHGISEWSERYQAADKQNNHVRTASPSHYVVETTRSNGYKQDSPRNQVESRTQKETSYSRTYETSRRQPPPDPDHRKIRHEHRQRDDPPSPPLRRRVREQISTRSDEKNSYNELPVRTASPVLVVQRTWENRSKDVQQQVSGFDRAEARRHSPQLKTPPRSRSISPVQKIIQPSRRDKKSIVENVEKSHTSKNPAQSKYKIGESFRKLVGKLRSASSERKIKRASNSSTSQLTQTDDDSTYRQYNVIDRNIPLVTEDDGEDKPPERPPRSPRNSATIPTVIKTVKTTKSNGYSSHEPLYHRNGSSTPVHRYYVGEDPYVASSRESYSRDKVYRDGNSKSHARTREPSRYSVERDYSVESNSLGRFSKSTSRLTNEYDRDDQFRSTQTLPRKLHSVGQTTRTSQTTSRRPPASTAMNHVKQSQTSLSSSTRPNQSSRQYGSMINISIKNAITSQKSSPITPSTLQGPAKPERTYKSSLSRSKSFNVEASRNGNDHTTPNIPYKSNLQLNRLDETPPLKSPGILASISRSNRDIFKESKHEY